MFAKYDRYRNAKYLKSMLAHLKNIEWLFCFQDPVAYAHRQRSVALRAKTKQPDLYGRSTTKQPDLYGRSTTKQPDLYGRSTTQRALRAVIPLAPPAPSPPAQARGARGGQAVGGVSLLPQPKPWGRGGTKRWERLAHLDCFSLGSNADVRRSGCPMHTIRETARGSGGCR